MSHRPASRLLATTLGLALLAGCSKVAPNANQRPEGVPATLAAAETLDRATAIKLSANVLANAMDNGDTSVVNGFVSYADGQDPEPAATREIARAAGNLTRLKGDVARIASGGAHPRAVTQADAIRFPEDEGDHPYAITEWWYVNGHLEGQDKNTYGFEFTLFKVGPLLHWAHVAVTDQWGQRFTYAREWIPPKSAAAKIDKLAVNYAGQAIERLQDGRYLLAGHAEDQRLQLTLASKKQPLLIGGNGKIDMPEGKDSWYYSLTRLDASGTLNGKPVKGIGWLDHQWGPFWVSGIADRWDWFSLQFDDQTEYNLFGFRGAGGQAGRRHVNVSQPDGRGTVGTQFTMDRLAWWQSPRTKLHFTTKWKIDLPESHESVELEATNVDQEVYRKVHFLRDPLPNYWEGSMRAVKIGADGKRTPGRAYCEHFGFKTPVGPR